MTSRVKMLSVEKALNRQLQQADGLSSNRADTSNLAQGAAALKLSKSGCALRTHEQLRRLDVIDRSRNRRGLHENGRMVLSAHRLLKYEKQRKEHWAAVTKKGKAGGYFCKSHATVARRNLESGEEQGEQHEQQRCSFP
jgi:hypothetical protein